MGGERTRLEDFDAGESFCYGVGAGWGARAGKGTEGTKQGLVKYGGMRWRGLWPIRGGPTWPPNPRFSMFRDPDRVLKSTVLSPVLCSVPH